MTAILIETSSKSAGIALCKNGELIAQRPLAGDSTLSKIIFLSIQDLIRECDLDLRQLTYIGLGIGPGSYTGTRVGATIAKTLSFALNIPIISFSSPLAFLSFEEGTFASLLERKGGDYFTILGEKRGGSLYSIFPHKYVPASALASELEGVSFVICESDLNLCAKHIKPTLHLASLAPYIHAKWQKKEYDSEEGTDLLYFNPLIFN
ncbi:MAG: tRNA (adenosine(37)-N6)-threonylcarbamoyltransferase complex dimerization subunit type 1 TsaB [Chlamydiales bacterium]|nr:tRNA (adenosine(37)-N6)-threonylcarbamoyltransferase complex dimerization subunit type 1 TsaB [Chlamydiales bacterium]